MIISSLLIVNAHHKRIKILFLFPVVVLCATPMKIKEIMLAAEELNMVDSGEYVFFNIELLNR